MRRIAVGAAGAAMAVGLLGVPAGAEPQGRGLTTDSFTCDGEPVEIVVTRGGGVTGWIDSTHLKARAFIFTDPSGETFTQSFGQGPKGDTIRCSSSSDLGTFTVVAVTIPGSR